jgi:hypothetical protein
LEFAKAGAFRCSRLIALSPTLERRFIGSAVG